MAGELPLISELFAGFFLEGSGGGGGEEDGDEDVEDNDKLDTGLRGVVIVRGATTLVGPVASSAVMDDGVGLLTVVTVPVSAL